VDRDLESAMAAMLMQTTNPLTTIGIGGILILGLVIFFLFKFVFRGG
jgi:hypothetical protein